MRMVWSTDAQNLASVQRLLSRATPRKIAMHAKLNIYKAAPDLMKALTALDGAVHAAGLEPALMELVKTRASQINGCAYCIYVHTRDARAKGETEQRLYMLDAWRESTLYSDKERSALAWTEALTLISQNHAPDAVYDQVRAAFDEAGVAKLTLLIATINVWNRIAIGLRSQHPVEAAVGPDAVTA
jgi:AhpD family alkylhydroperoxidase